MQDEIGTVAGVIWRTLNASGESTLPKLRKQVQNKTPAFDWAIGWLAREDKIAITRHRQSFRVRLKDDGTISVRGDAA